MISTLAPFFISSAEGTLMMSLVTGWGCSIESNSDRKNQGGVGFNPRRTARGPVSQFGRG